MHHKAVFVILVLAFARFSHAQAPQTVPYDHVHLAVPDPQQAYDWYVRYMNGNVAEFPGRVAFQPWTGRPPLPAQLLFNKAPAAQPSVGSSIESLAFSFADLDSKMTELQAAGVKVIEPVRSPSGQWKRAVIEDPWGVRLDLIQDRQLLGLHHIAVRAPDVEATLEWYLRAFGGQRIKLDGRLDAVKYGNIYLAVVNGKGVPSRGRAIDHISWGPTGITATVEALRTKGVKVTNEVGGPNSFGHHTAYVEDPNGVAIELVQHDEFLNKP